MIKFKTFKYFDDQVFKCEAFSMLVPEGWNVSGGIYWRQHATMPGAVTLSLRSPDGLYELNIHPSMPYYWNSSSFSLLGPREGSYYMGNEVRRPVSSPLQYIQQYILPRSGFKVRVTGNKSFHELEDELRASNPVPFGCRLDIGACISQLEYEYNGTLFEGDITCGVVSSTMMYGQISWYVDKIFSTRFPQGKKQESSMVFAAILKSFRFDLKWFSYYHEFVQSLTQYVMQDIYNAGVISRIISNTFTQISDTMKRSYESQQASYDKIFRGISEGIRGVNSYYDPYKGFPVEFPVDYKYVYANPLGEYIVTDNPNYNPNVGSNLNWTILDRQ